MIESKWGSLYKVILSLNDQMVWMIQVIQVGPKLGDQG